jgi:hypothetical protein
MFTARHKGVGGVHTTPAAEGAVNTVGGSDTSHWEPVPLGLWLGVLEGDAPKDSDAVGDVVMEGVLDGVEDGEGCTNTAHDMTTLPSPPLMPVAPPPAAPVA